MLKALLKFNNAMVDFINQKELVIHGDFPDLASVVLALVQKFAKELVKAYELKGATR